MRKTILTTAAIVGAAALTATSAMPAIAATDDTTATVEVTAGVLSIAAPASLSLSDVAPGMTSSGTLTGVQVSDQTADVAGWTASISITDFVSESVADAIPAEGVSYTPTAATVLGDATVTAATVLDGAGVVQTATGVNGNNTATWNALVQLQVPQDALAADDYTATLTHSVL